MNHNFKKIQIVPGGNDFLDIVLSKTQRKTPTVVHKGYQISRIRSFYMRKVKFTQESFDEKLSQILTDFPKLEDVHPFYSDLMNILYDKDHYKLALGQLNSAKHLIDNVGKEYVKLLKFGDSLYRCKQLKRAALGRMATIMRRQKDSLAYLEQVRQHLARLPSIDPSSRTLILCGYPNVGKSSFMNKVTRAEVEVQPYAFTTKSLFVGHLDYKYLRWQVIDTPGILDHPLEDRNTIEMQSITALAHIRACVLYFLDPSESCGYTLAQQVSLFHSIKPLFVGKPILLVSNKCDIVRLAELSQSDRHLFDSMLPFADGVLDVLEASTMTEEGVMAVRNAACEKLLSQRIENKLTKGGKANVVNDILGRLHVTQPKARDELARPPVIPSIIQERLLQHGNAHGGTSDIPLEIDLERDALAKYGFYNIDLRKHYQLERPEWKQDIIPEIMNGKNISDFIDPDIEAHLAMLEAEEEAAEARGDYDVDVELEEEARAMRELKSSIDEKRTLLTKMNRLKTSVRKMAIPMKLQLKKKNTLLRRKAVAGPEFDSDNESNSNKMQVDDNNTGSGRSKSSRSVSCTPRFNGIGERSLSRVIANTYKGLDVRSKSKSTELQKTAQIARNTYGRAGDADRHIQCAKPKHLFAGKRKNGTHNRR